MESEKQKAHRQLEDLFDQAADAAKEDQREPGMRIGTMHGGQVAGRDIYNVQLRPASYFDWPEAELLEKRADDRRSIWRLRGLLAAAAALALLGLAATAWIAFEQLAQLRAGGSSDPKLFALAVLCAVPSLGVHLLRSRIGPLIWEYKESVRAINAALREHKRRRQRRR